MGNGYGTVHSTVEAGFRAYDMLPPRVRELLRGSIASWSAEWLSEELAELFHRTGSRSLAIDLIHRLIQREEAEDTYRTYGPDHPQADNHGRRLRPAANACWGARAQ